MLQQTRVAVVIPYYERFLKCFPDAGALARAEESQVLAMWGGLGYYSRARNLRKAAQWITGRGGFPADYDSIRALAGVGDYTAAAISSIAFGLPHAAIDGHVRRVIIRLTGDDKVDVQREASRLLDGRDPGRWNQAVMELGATVCLPREPRCSECPVAAQCGARLNGRQAVLPAKRVKPATVRIKRTLLVIRRGDHILLEPSARVKGFWDLPELCERARVGKVVGEFRHTITHHQYRFVIRQATITELPKSLRWWTNEEINEIPLSTTAKKALRCLKI